MTTRATSSWPTVEADPERTAILAAADRMLAGEPTTSTGRLSVVQLAIEAEVKYWVIAQKHTDLRDHFQRLAAQAKATSPPSKDSPASAPSQPSTLEQLTKHNAGLEELVAIYAQVINELSAENKALRGQLSGGSGNVTPFRRRPHPQDGVQGVYTGVRRNPGANRSTTTTGEE